MKVRVTLEGLTSAQHPEPTWAFEFDDPDGFMFVALPKNAKSHYAMMEMVPEDGCARASLYAITQARLMATEEHFQAHVFDHIFKILGKPPKNVLNVL